MSPQPTECPHLEKAGAKKTSPDPITSTDSSTTVFTQPSTTMHKNKTLPTHAE